VTWISASCVSRLETTRSFCVWFLSYFLFVCWFFNVNHFDLSLSKCRECGSCLFPFTSATVFNTRSYANTVVVTVCFSSTSFSLVLWTAMMSFGAPVLAGHHSQPPLAFTRFPFHYHHHRCRFIKSSRFLSSHLSICMYLYIYIEFHMYHPFFPVFDFTSVSIHHLRGEYVFSIIVAFHLSLIVFISLVLLVETLWYTMQGFMCQLHDGMFHQWLLIISQ